MNIWSFQKHKNIKLLMFRAFKQLGTGHFYVDDDNDLDFYSIALFKPQQPDVRAYVFNYGQAHNQYGIHLEYPWFVENEFNDTILVYEDLSLNQVVNTLATHFEVARYDIAG